MPNDTREKELIKEIGEVPAMLHWSHLLQTETLGKLVNFKVKNPVPWSVSFQAEVGN